MSFFVSATELGKLKRGQNIQYHFYGDKQLHQAKIDYLSNTSEYMPPILYTPDHQEELIFRVRAKPTLNNPFALGQPVEVLI